MSESIRLSDHFSYSKLLRFTLPSICMMVFTSIYGVVDGLFVSNFVGYDTDLCALTTHAFTLFSWSFLLVGFNIFASGFFTALNNGAISAAISFLRTLVFQSGAVLLLPLLLDVDGIWWAITAAECFAFLISVIFLVAKRNKYHYM